MRLRILALTNCPLVEWQGSGYVVAGFGREMRRRGHHVETIGPETLLPFAEQHRGRSVRYPVAILAVALRKVAVESYDVIEFWGAEAWLAVSILAAAPWRRFILVARSNGLEPHYQEVLARHGLERHRQMRRVLEERAFGAADGLTTVSAFDGQYAVEHGWMPHVTLPNALPDCFLGREISSRPRAVIGFCGGWAANKGVALLVTDITRVLRERRDAEFRVLGGAQEVLRSFPADVSAQIRVLPPTADKPEMVRRYSECAILVAPSFYESFGLAVAEAMACGCAVVSTRVGFAWSLKDREEVCHIEPASPRLYEAVTQLLDDDALRATVAAGGHRRVQSLRWSDAGEKLEHAYADWLRVRRSRL
ncbi:MAG TPA: glycosyltransferase family 4 protein [Planctomycetota bacterium]|nr:glycosyltransferase family 4 protein [Planctomycetota bacterium]